jgi:hypothetical protein
MDSNHRKLGVNQPSLPLDHGTLSGHKGRQATIGARVAPVFTAAADTPMSAVTEVGVEPTNIRLST